MTTATTTETSRPKLPEEIETAACELGDESCGCPPSHRRAQRVLFSVVGVLLITIVILGIYVRFTS